MNERAEILELLRENARYTVADLARMTGLDENDAAEVVEALEARDTPAAVVGRVESGSGVYADGERVQPPDRDPSWAAAERLSEAE